MAGSLLNFLVILLYKTVGFKKRFGNGWNPVGRTLTQQPVGNNLKVTAWKSIEYVASPSRCTKTVTEERNTGEGLPLGSEQFDSS
jgi:hypothetical protein